MAALTDWISNIILLILIAVIMDLLVPNTSLTKYVKMVIGLLLILILLSPLLNIFSMDETKILQSISLNETVSDAEFENSMNVKKREIEVAQAAYIVEQMAVQMKNQVKEELMNRYDVKISYIDLVFNQNDNESYENIQKVHVDLVAKNTIEPVEEIIIGHEENVEETHENVEPIRKFLAEKWGIDEEKISINTEGGES